MSEKFASPADLLNNAAPQMTNSDKSDGEHEALKREAYQWIARLTSGDATVADAEELNRWRQRSKAHRAAFAEANLLWQSLRPATKEIADRDAVLSVGQASTAHRRFLGRRAFLGGAAAASAAAAAYLVVRPPLDLWPSLSEISADYRTGVGGQERLVLASDVSVELNTRTSITMLPTQLEGGSGIELIAGEASITTPRQTARPFIVVAARGRTIATEARFNVRQDVASVCITCLDGDVRVEHLGQTAMVPARQQVTYSPSGLGPVGSADTEVVTAWQRGLLVFRNAPLAHVIDELNRYRPGRIILTNAELGRRQVLATFRLDRLDEVVQRLQVAFGAQIRELPGGIVLVG